MRVPISTRDIAEDGLECGRLLENSTDDSAKKALVICALRFEKRMSPDTKAKGLPTVFGASLLWTSSFHKTIFHHETVLTRF
jgi:hypothetical protein